MQKLYSIRGAITCENTEESIKEATALLCRTVFTNNNLTSENIVNIQFSLTKDLDAFNPCTALRSCDVGFDTSTLPLFCTQEATVKNMTQKVIRLMVTAYLPSNSTIQSAYLKGAAILRQDIATKD